MNRHSMNNNQTSDNKNEAAKAEDNTLTDKQAQSLDIPHANSEQSDSLLGNSGQCAENPLQMDGKTNSPYSTAQQQTSTPQPNREDARALRSAQSKITFAYIAGPLSLFIGGMLLGTIGLICAYLAYRKLGQLSHKEASIADAALKLKKSARTALIVCAVAFFVNGVSMIVMYPVIVDMLQNGQYGDIAGNMGAGSAASNSVWG